MLVISPWEETKQGESQVSGLPNVHNKTSSKKQPNLNLSIKEIMK